MNDFSARRDQIISERAGGLRLGEARSIAQTYVRVMPRYAATAEEAERIARMGVGSLGLEEMRGLAKEYYRFLLDQFEGDARIQDADLAWFQMIGARPVLESNGLLRGEYKEMFDAMDNGDKQRANRLRHRIAGINPNSQD